MTEKLKIAGIGAGYFSQFHYEAWSRLDVDLVAICDRDLSCAKHMAQTYNIPTIVESVDQITDVVKPDLVDIIVPPADQLACIELAAKNGIHAICQKPFTENLEQAQRAIAIAKDAGMLLVIHENFRFQPWHKQVKTLLDENLLGKVYQATFRLRPGDGQGPEAYLARQPYFQQQEKFLINETGVHFIDVFRYLFGEIISVWADLHKLNPVIAGEDAGIFVCHFEDGCRAVFDGNRLVDHQAEDRRLTMGEFLIEGENGCLRVDGNGNIFHRRHNDNEEQQIDYEWSDHAYAGDCVFQLQKHVVNHLQHGSELFNAAENYLDNLKIVDAIYASNNAKRQMLIKNECY